MSLDRAQVHNFAAGPSPLPTPVLEQAAAGLVNYAGTGMGVCELSHRGKEFKAIIEGAEANLRTLLSIPDDYAVLFMQGGGTGQFSSVVLNLLSARRLARASTDAASYAPPPIDYVVTGAWSSKAYAEAQRLSAPSVPGGAPFAVPRIAATSKSSKYTTLPRADEYEFNADAAFVYYCENETINGIQFPGAGSESEFAFPFARVPEGVPVVADCSSSFLSRPIDVAKHAIIYAGAQKNLGPSGVTVVIVRRALLVDTTAAQQLGAVPATPITSEYKVMADNASLYNTPPVFPIYVSALVLDHLRARGGIAEVERVNRAKATALYAAIDDMEAHGKVRAVVRNKEARSWMNVTFEITGDGEKAFLAGAEDRGFRQLKGHRSVGGIRASLYNAVTLDSVQALVEYLQAF
ncbi:Phosphoserine transaminase [Cryptotrichosporon argae]